MKDVDKFIATIRTSGNISNSLEITIPYKLVEFMGLKEGDIVTILIKKNNDTLIKNG